MMRRTSAVIVPAAAAMLLLVAAVFSANAVAQDVVSAQTGATADGELAVTAQPVTEQPTADSTGPKGLQALVMDVRGKAQWKGAEEGAVWKSAAVDDLLDPGVQIRTGRDSALTLRIGKNATATVASLSRITLPQIIEDGQTLRTAVELNRGQTDFKVDRVGLTNDFSIVTPSGVLAVRGTGLRTKWGGFNGLEVNSFAGNDMRAIEVRYFLSRFRYYLNARSNTSNQSPDPALNALFDTVGPPPLLGTPVTPGMLEAAAADAGVVQEFIAAVQQLEQAPSAEEIGQGLLSDEEFMQIVQQQQPDLPDLGDFDDIQLLLMLLFCQPENFNAFFNDFAEGLKYAGIFGKGGKNEAYFDFLDLHTTALEFCGTIDENIQDPFLNLLDRLTGYCINLDGGGSQTDACLEVLQEVLGDFIVEHFADGSIELGDLGF